MGVERPLTPQEAADLLLQRKGARVNYRDYLKYWIKVTHAPFMWNWHIDYLCDIMQAVADRDSAVRFSIINIPPRFMKSTIISQQWQAWMLGRDSSRRSSLFSIGTTGTLAARDSRRTLDTIESEWYRALFPTIALGTKQTETEWEVTGGGYRLACGTGGTVTGRGADHLTVDDPLKADEADSETVREGVNEWLGETLRSRLDDQMTGTITVIMQRLHERDPTGYLLDQMKIPGADQYAHFLLPNEATAKTIVHFKQKVYAERNEGELLHPSRIGPKETAALKAAMRNNYEGQYQQNPVKMTGGHLDPRRLLRLQGSALEIKSRLGLTPVFYLDFAATTKQADKNDPDYSVIHAVARDQLGRLIHLDIWRKQLSDYAEFARTLIQMWKLWRPRFVKGEKGALLNVFQPVLQQQMALSGTYLTLEPLPSRTSDKIERSMPYQGMLNAGMVCVPEVAPWLDAFEREMRAFWNGAHDDMLEGGWDAAADYQMLPRGEAPSYSPTDPSVLLSDEVKARIEKARDRQLNPIASDPDDW